MGNLPYLFWLLAQTVQNFSLKPSCASGVVLPLFSMPATVGAGAMATPFDASIMSVVVET